MKRDDEAYLLDMLEAAREAMSFADNLSYSDFQQSRVLQRAICNAVQELGEAAARLSPHFKQTHTNITWSEIVAMRTSRSWILRYRLRPCIRYG